MTDDEDSEGAIATRIVARIRAGGADAAAARHDLVERYSSGLEKLMRWKCGDPDLAKDLRQDTLMRALAKLEGEGLKEPHKLASWLNGIASNLLMNHNNKARRRNTHTAGSFDDIVIVSNEPLPGDTLANEEIGAVVDTLLGELFTEEYRDVLRRVFWHDEDPAEICDALGCSRAQLSRLLYKAKARFKKLLLIAERRKGFHIVPPDEDDES